MPLTCAGQSGDLLHALVLPELYERVVAAAAVEIVERHSDGRIEAHHHQERGAGGYQNDLRHEQPALATKHVAQGRGVRRGKHSGADSLNGAIQPHSVRYEPPMP